MVTPSVVPPSAAPMPAPMAASPPVPPNQTPLIIAGAVIAVLLIALLVVVVVNANSSSNESAEEFGATTSSSTTTSTTSTTTTTTTAAAPAPAPAPATPSPPPTNATGLPTGLFCRDLNARGVSYFDAVDYWTVEGAPDRMDADLDGVPCETVYPLPDIIAYWGFDPSGGGGGVPSGLFCRDLNARGFSYFDAVDYWIAEGAPDRMDADLDGVPCETVYPLADVIAYWGFDPS